MTHACMVGLLLAAALFGCGGEDGTGNTGAEDARALIAQMAESYDGALTHRCECLVAEDLLYDSVDACQESIGWASSGEECLGAAFDEHGTDELQAALSCHVGHLEDANACADSVSCEELVLGGACDAQSAENPCGQAAVDLGTFIFEHCPELSLLR